MEHLTPKNKAEDKKEALYMQDISLSIFERICEKSKYNPNEMQR